MLELIAFSRIHRLHHTVLRPAHDPASRPLLRVFSSLGGKNTDIGGRYFFCSESGDGSDQVVDARVRAAEEEYQSKASAIVSTYPRPKDYLTELELETDGKTALTGKFREKIEPKRENCPPHILRVIDEELVKLQLLEASSSEFSVTCNYLDCLTALPWGYSDENFDVTRAQKILDEDLYGLTDVKERILES